MTPESFLDELKGVLGSERDAIRRLDATTIAIANEKKEALLALVSNASAADKPGLIMALGQVREDLKRNLILLAHARDLVREAVRRASPAGLPDGARISIKL